jgi:beta-glucosidase
MGNVTDSAEPAETPAVSRTDADFERRLGRPIPWAQPARPFTRDSTIGDFSVTLVGRVLRFVVQRMTKFPEEAKNDLATMALLEASVDELPLRGLAQFSEGRLGWALVDAVIALANLRPPRAPRALLSR